MLSERQFNRQAMANKTLLFSQAPPVGGWNSRDDISDMDPRDAAYLENWFPDTTAVKVRNGCTFDTLIVGANGFETLATFESDEESALIIGSGGSIFVYNDHIPVLERQIGEGFSR